MGAAERPTGYDELADVLAALPLLVREARRARGLSLRAAAKQMGLSFSTVNRLEHGEGVVLSNAVTAMRWLNTRPGALGATENDEGKR